VLDARADEHDGAWPRRPILLSDTDHAAPVRHVIHLVLCVWPLRIGHAGRQSVYAGAECRRAQEFQVQPA
jgi:hypothetical protein